jgi:hypothetical protein
MQLSKHLFFLAHQKVGGIRHEGQQSLTQTSEKAGSGIRPPVITTASGRESGEPEASIAVSGKGEVSGMV